MKQDSEPETLHCPECGGEFGETDDCLACEVSREADELLRQMQEATS